MRTRSFIICVTIGLLGLWERPAHATRDFQLTAQTPSAPAPVAMGSAGTLTFRIANANTGGNTGERIYEVRFRMASGRSTFASSTVAPAGWSRTAYSTTSVTFQATSWVNAIATGSSKDFPINFNFRTTTADTIETLRDIRARYTTTSGGPPFSNAGSDSDSTQGSWTLSALSVTSFQITDLSGVPVSTIAAGTSFKLILTVKNISSASQSSIIANPNPPTTIETGTVTQGLTSTVYSPNPLTLAAGASGTITFTYSTLATDNGTIQFSASTRNGAGTATSSTATSNVLTVNRLNVSIAVTPSCLFSGSTATFTMTVTNNSGGSVVNVTPSALTRFTANSASIGTFTGPTPASIASLANGASGTFTWTAPVTGTVPASGAKPLLWVTGFATANAGSIVTPTATSNQEDVDEYLVSVAPGSTGSGSGAELVWTVSNRGCAPVNSVALSIPSGWTFGNDTYSAVDLSATSTVDTWTSSGSGPVGFTAAPTSAERLPVDFTGDFSLVFSATPTVTGNTSYNFTVTITDAAATPNVRTPITSVTIAPFDAMGVNATTFLGWREEFP